ncbi:hypothetical protein [Kordiimonas sp.]|uniref:DUF7448 domain-containing protein n=1 Tax=Kordiimonas sp. TaxID=1970157 RepID=UPI003A8D8B03
MSFSSRVEIGSLVGEVLTHVDADENGEEILLTTASGRQITIHHDQDCCEHVRIEGTDGSWHELIGKVIVDATKDEREFGDPPPAFPDSWTRTDLTFRVDGATVVSRWIGESNGYYSESVDIDEIASTSKANQ